MTLWQETGLALSRQSWCDKSARMSLQPPTGKIKPDGSATHWAFNHRGLPPVGGFKCESFLVTERATLTGFGVYGLCVLFLPQPEKVMK